MSGGTTHRALLGAVAASPLVALVASSALASLPVAPGAFAAARRKVEIAEAAANAYRRDVFDPAWARYEALRGPDVTAPPTPAQRAAIDATGFVQAEEAYGAVLDAVWDAQEVMLLASAPDLAAIAHKLDVMIAQETWHDTHVPAVMAQLRADVAYPSAC